MPTPRPPLQSLSYSWRVRGDYYAARADALAKGSPDTADERRTLRRLAWAYYDAAGRLGAVGERRARSWLLPYLARGAERPGVGAVYADLHGRLAELLARAGAEATGPAPVGLRNDRSPHVRSAGNAAPRSVESSVAPPADPNAAP